MTETTEPNRTVPDLTKESTQLTTANNLEKDFEATSSCILGFLYRRISE